MGRLLAIGFGMGLLGGCASLPPVEMSWPQPAAATDVTVIQTAACDPSGSSLVVGYAVTTQTSYFRHPTAPRHTLALRELGSAWADASATFGFTEDGRLKSVNTTSTGQGEAIVRAGSALVTALSALGATDPCEPIRTLGEDGVVTLVYRGRVVHHEVGADVDVELSLTDRDEAIRQLTGLDAPSLRLGAPVRIPPPFALEPGARTDDLVMLPLNHTATRSLTVRGGPDRGVLWETSVTVPETATWQAPVPRAALFGSRKFELSLSEAGRPLAIGYTGASGGSSAISAAAAAATAAADDSVLTEAAETKAEADLIAQQQRLVRCRANPETCI